jgi:uncharacterized damage-inducible protein DinB
MIGNLARRHFSYNAWAHRRVWDCVAQVSDDLWTQSVGYSLGSLQSQYVHVLSVDRRWFARLKGEAPPAALSIEAFPTREILWAAWERAEAYHRAFLADVTDEELAMEIEYDLPHRGGPKRNTGWEILAHVVNHGTDHRGQILATLHGLGAPTVEQDMMFFLWES